jgi:hypothetical protein
MTPIPQHVHDRAELLSRSHPLQVVAELIGKKPSVVTRMKQRGWKAADYSPRRRPLPNDWQIQAYSLTFDELVRHYRAGTNTVVRWLREKPVRKSMRGIALRRSA